MTLTKRGHVYHLDTTLGERRVRCSLGVSDPKAFDDSCGAALDFIDKLPAQKRKSAHLHSKLIEAEYDKRGTMMAGLYEWSVTWKE
jgi:hypothetical protein